MQSLVASACGHKAPPRSSLPWLLQKAGCLVEAWLLWELTQQLPHAAAPGVASRSGPLPGSSGAASCAPCTLSCVWHGDQKAVCHCLAAILNLAYDSNQQLCPGKPMLAEWTRRVSLSLSTSACRSLTCQQHENSWITIDATDTPGVTSKDHFITVIIE